MIKKDAVKQILQELITENPEILSGTNMKVVTERYINIFRKDVETALSSTGKERCQTYKIQTAIYNIIKATLNINAMAHITTKEQYEQAKDVTNRMFDAIGYTCRIQ